MPGCRHPIGRPAHRGEEAFALQLGDGPAHGDATAGVPTDELALGQEGVAQAELAALDAVAQGRPESSVQGRPSHHFGGLLLHVDTL
jgi:hypothetical protein